MACWGNLNLLLAACLKGFKWKDSSYSIEGVGTRNELEWFVFFFNCGEGLVVVLGHDGGRGGKYYPT